MRSDLARLVFFALSLVSCASLLVAVARADEPQASGEPGAVVLLVESRGVNAPALRRAVSERLGRPVLSLLDEGASGAPLFVSVSTRGPRVAVVVRPLHGSGASQRFERPRPRGGQIGLARLIAETIQDASASTQPASGGVMVRGGDHERGSERRGTQGRDSDQQGSQQRDGTVATNQGASVGDRTEAQLDARPATRAARDDASTGTRDRRSTARSTAQSASRRADDTRWPGGIVVEVIDPFRSTSRGMQLGSRLHIDSGVLDPWSSARIAYLTETLDPWGGKHPLGPLATSEVIDPFSPTPTLNIGLLDPWVASEARESGAGLSEPRPITH